MSEPTDDDTTPLVDPADFGPEAIDGSRPPGTEPGSTTPADPDVEEPGDPELHADPEDEPSS